MSETVDYIIVGSGAAGSVLAARLAESGRDDVLVIENGPPDRNPLHRIPKGFFFTLNGDRYVNRYRSLPIDGTATSEVFVRGCVVGGSTTINGMMYSRGSEADYTALAKHTGAEHWGWDRVLEAYRSMEDHALGPSPLRGTGGPLAITANGPRDELSDRIFAAAEEIGWQRVDDINEDDGERIGFTPSTVRAGRRVSAATAFLRPALRTGRVRLVTRTRIGRLLQSGGRVCGVVGAQRGRRVEFRARKEVIVACGTIETPLLLERSGLGRPEVLRSLGIDVVVEAPNVGERVLEHHSPGRVQVRLNRRLGATEQFNSLVKQMAQGAVYLVGRRGPIATAGYDFTYHCKSEPGLGRDDLNGSVTPFALDATASRMKLADHSGLLVGCYQTRPETPSSIHASGQDPEAPPVIAPRYFDTETDRRASGRTLGRMRELLAAGPLAEVIDVEEMPTDAVDSNPDRVLEHAIRSGGTIHHSVGSCAMGPDAADPVDECLRFRGIDGLRVVDASVLPFHVSGNPGAPVMAVAWVAGGLIANS